MSYLLNYKNWRALHESKAINEGAEDVDNILDLSKLVISDDAKKDLEQDKEAWMQIIEDNGMLFSIDNETAAYLLADNYNGSDGKSIRGTELIKLNVGPEDSNKILTHGVILPDKIQRPTNVSAESEYTNIVKFLNNHALLSWIGEATWNDKDSSMTGVGLKVFTDKNGSMDLSFMASGDFHAFYGTVAKAAAQSKEVVKTTVWTVPEQGKTIEKKLPGTMFATGQVTLADSTELDKAIAELNELIKDKNTKITAITVESSASGDRGVGGKSGYPSEADVAANKYPLGKPYLPKSAEESGNAKLAFGRAETIKAKLGNLAPITVKTMIQNGGDAAQYAKIIATVEKVDKPAQTLTKQELENVLLKKSSAEDLSQTRSIKLIKIDR